MLVRLLLVTCLVAVAGHPKARDIREPLLATGGAAELVQKYGGNLCSAIVMMDNTTIHSTIFKDLRAVWTQWQVLAIFKVNMEAKNTNSADHLSKVISSARQVRHFSSCTMVVVVSHNPTFLNTFAEMSLKGRLLVWATRLIVVTLVSLPQLQVLLPGHWTYSMMNAVFLNMEGDAKYIRYSVYTYLPYSPGGSQVVKIASWTSVNGFKYIHPVSFFEDKFVNFHGTAVNVTAQPYMPYWGEEHTLGAHVYRGSDYHLLENVASALNFTVQVVPTSSWAEVTNLVEQRISFIAPIIHVVLTTRSERYDFTYTYEYTPSAFAMAIPSLEPRWKSLYYPLKNEVWMALTVPLLLVPFILDMLIRARESWGGGRNVGVGLVLQDMVGMLLGQNLPHRLSDTSSSRVLIAAWLVFVFIIAVIYRGNLTASLTLPKYPPRPETIEEVVDAVDMVTIPPFGEQHRKFYSQSESPLFQALGRLMNPGPSLMEGLTRALVEKSSHFEAKKYLQYEILDKFTKEDGSTRLYLTRESTFPSPSGWPIPHDAPYKAHLDRLIMTTLEAGLYSKWTTDIMTQTKRKNQIRLPQRQAADDQQPIREKGDESEEGLPILTLSHMQGGFILLMGGLVLAMVVFTREMLPSTLYTDDSST